MEPKLLLIVAACDGMGIGMGIGMAGKLPWRLRKEVAFFAKMTKSTSDGSKQNAVVMGRKTWESIPAKNKPLAGRINIVLSSQQLDICANNVHVCHSFKGALDLLKSTPLSDLVENVWIIGGSSLYKAALSSDCCHRIYLTRIYKSFQCDVFMPDFQKDRCFQLINDGSVPQGMQEENGIQYKYEVYEKVSPA